MKRIEKRVADDDMRAEYDFTGAVRGKYYDRVVRSSNVVVLEPDVFAAFPNSASVNAALRSLAAASGKGKRVVRRPSTPQKRTSKRELRRRSAKKPR
jgi:hypothetical protein